MKGNQFVALMLRSPLHVFMGNTMLLTVTGRKTGRAIDIPVNYYQEGNTLWVISSRDRTWWRNLRGGGDVRVRLHGRKFRGSGEAILDEKDVAVQLGQYVRRLPFSARYIGVRMADDVPNAEDIARVSRERLFIRICLP